MRLGLLIPFAVMVLGLLGCTTSPTGGTVLKLPECNFNVGSRYPMAHCRAGGGGIPMPGTGR